MWHPDLYLSGTWLIPCFGKIESKTSDGIRSWRQDAGGCEHRCDVLTTYKAPKKRVAVFCPSWILHSLLTLPAWGEGWHSQKWKGYKPPHLFSDSSWLFKLGKEVYEMPYAASLDPPFSYPPILFHLLACSQIVTTWSSYSDLNSSKFNISLSKEHQNISGNVL